MADRTYDPGQPVLLRQEQHAAGGASEGGGPIHDPAQNFLVTVRARDGAVDGEHFAIASLVLEADRFERPARDITGCGGGKGNAAPSIHRRRGCRQARFKSRPQNGKGRKLLQLRPLRGCGGGI